MSGSFSLLRWGGDRVPGRQVGCSRKPVSAQVKIAYINFLNHCYVDTEVEMKEIYTSNHMWKLFENFLVDICRVSFLAPGGRANVHECVCVHVHVAVCPCPCLGKPV